MSEKVWSNNLNSKKTFKFVFEADTDRGSLQSYQKEEILNKKLEIVCKEIIR